MVALLVLLIVALVAVAVAVGSRVLDDHRRIAGWTSTEPMSVGRVAFTATLLQTGKVLVTGGGSTERTGNIASVELFDPATGSWSLTTALPGGRRFHTATLLPDGRVLVV